MAPTMAQAPVSDPHGKERNHEPLHERAGAEAAECQGHKREFAASRRTGRDRIRVAALESGDADAVFAMLGRCSAATMYLRFHGVTDGISHATGVLADPVDQDAYGAWSAERCVALASLAVDGDGSGHIGVLVEDRWQRRGAGSALMAALAGRARERRLPSLVADVLAANEFIIPLLAPIGPTTTSFCYGVYRVRVSLESPRHIQCTAFDGIHIH